MVNRTFDELARDLKQRREIGDPPMVVLLGAGASLDAGIGAMTDLFQFVNVTDFDEFVAYINPYTSAERYRLLARFLQSRQPAAVTPGYRALAALCAEAYFDLVLTTNLDPLLDDALAAAQLWRKDYLLVVNGVIRPERLDLLLAGNSPRVKVVKLHGDLFHRYMAWTPSEMDTFLADIANSLNPPLHGRDLLIVGHSLRDARIRKLALDAGGVIWYTNPNGVPDFLSDNDRVRAVIGFDATFEKLFPRLATSLSLETQAPPSAAVAPSPAVARERALTGDRRPAREEVSPAEPPAVARTVDDLMASVVALGLPTGQVSSTGFVLADPRVVVIDGYVGNTFFIEDKATIQSFDGRRFEARILRRHDHPFGPIILEVPGELRVPGLKVNPTPPAIPNLPVRIAVAAGERIGISSGVLIVHHEMTTKIEPIGVVKNLVPIQAVVAPGSSGAPVVDEKFNVRGFIVAGASDAPPALMYPSNRWASALKRDTPPRTGMRRAGKRSAKRGG
jgi:hypothetical protein